MTRPGVRFGHILTANVYDTIGYAYQGNGNNALALEYFGKSFLVFVSLFGPEDPRTMNAKKKVEEMTSLRQRL